MTRERILDIGIGGGGPYIWQNTKSQEQRIGIDSKIGNILNLKPQFPHVLPAVADAEYLPFKASAFSRIEIVLPFNKLMLPGLQNDHFALLQEYKAEYARNTPDGWYPEFYRILAPQGKMVIYADLWIDPMQVKKTSERFFSVEEVQSLSLNEFKGLGTSTVAVVVENGLKTPYIDVIDKKWEETLVKICLKSKKTR